ncbi:MAG: cbb3-type cytochrome oxidase assembly protein CcoS [Gallionellaceae bacterium]|nr:cbb3-type cytochrome oxidase assembly protein CcoS [Gallionellaceae bacterium]
MEILYLLIPLSVVLVFLIGAVFWWSVNNGQFDDLEGPGYRVLMDDDRPKSKTRQDEGAGVSTEGKPVDAKDGEEPQSQSLK